jgi:MFS family permease
MLPMSVVMVCTAPLAPRLVERIGTKIVVGSGLCIAAVGVFIVSTVPVTDGYPTLLAGTMVLALGMALTMAPATESIMGSLPPAKAGVGSAMNDTTRQMGGALGVAVLGSILAGIYRPGVESQLSALGLPAEAVERAMESVGTAIQGVAANAPAGLAEQIRDIAATEYVDGIHVAMKVGAAIILVAAGIVFAFLPARAKDPREAVEGPLDGLASLTYAEAEGVLEHDAAVEQRTLPADDELQPSDPGFRPVRSTPLGGAPR